MKCEKCKEKVGWNDLEADKLKNMKHKECGGFAVKTAMFSSGDSQVWI